MRLSGGRIQQGHDLKSTTIDHVDLNVENDDQAYILNPPMPIQKPGDGVRCQTHERDREYEPDRQHAWVLPYRACNGQHVIA